VATRSTAGPSAAGSDATPAAAGWRVAALAVAGVALGHLLAYAVVIPDAAARGAFLARTGHGYFPAFADAAVTLGAIGLVGSLLGGVARSSSPVGKPWALFRRLVLIQPAVFAALEIVERLTGHAPLRDLIHGDLLAGAAVQVLVAAAIAVVAWILRRAVERALVAGAPVDRPARAVVAIVRPALDPSLAPVRLRAVARAPPSHGGV
jgi:hypothetical protein